jgi:membrane protease YdiL (CAAX protease family)
VLFALVLLGTLGIGCVAIGVYIWGLKSKKVIPQGFTVGQVTDGVSDRLAFRMAVYLSGFLAIQVLAATAPKSLGLSKWPWAQATMMVLTFAFVIATLRIPFHGVQDTYRRLLGNLKNWPVHIGVGILGATANVPMILAVSLITNPLTKYLPQPSHPIQKDLASGSIVVIAAAFVSASILAPLLEELTFRGMLAPALSRLLKSPTAGILASGFLFAAIHPQGIAGIPMLMVIGCTAATVTRLSGSLLPAMVMHFVNNTAVLLLSLALNSL